MTRELVIDLSSYQAKLSVEDYKKIGATKAIIKVTEGTSYINPYANSLADKAAAGGVTGFSFYHFANFTTNISQANLEADYFIQNTRSKFKLAPGTTLYLDAENKGMSTSAVIAFLEKIKAAGYRAGFYTYKYLLSQFDLEQIKPYMDLFWIAAYPTPIGTRTPDFNYFPSAPYVDLWQYTDNLLGFEVDGSITLTENAIQSFNPSSAKVETKPITQLAMKPKEAPKTWKDGLGATWIAENGTFTTNTSINLRWGATPQSKLISTLPAGTSVKYDAFSRHDGYVWIRQPRQDGYGYLVCREGNTPLGSFK